MFHKNIYQRYFLELALFCFVVFFGLDANSLVVVALGLLVLSHCLPSLVLGSIRQLSHTQAPSVPTYYSNGFCSFREKEVVHLMSGSLIAGTSIGILFISLQNIVVEPIGNAIGVVLIGLTYIAIELAMYFKFYATNKRQPMERPATKKIIRVAVALVAIVIALIEHKFLQILADTLIGMGVILSIIFVLTQTLLDVARKNIDYAPRGMAVEDIKSFINTLPGVLMVNKIYFRRVNEVGHELGVHVTLEHYLLENSEALKDKIKREVERQFGFSGMTIELLWQKPIKPNKPAKPERPVKPAKSARPAKPVKLSTQESVKSKVIVLGHHE
ncbi:MAG: hypothetical protein AB8B87_10245 [Granulosicoccus sp.]